MQPWLWPELAPTERGGSSPLPAGKFRVVVCDPPWAVERVAVRGDAHRRNRALDYPVMSLDGIAALPVRSLLADDSWLFLWTIQRYLPDAYGLLSHWRLRYRFTMVWHKPGGFQPLNWPQSNAEFVVVGSLGFPQFCDLKAFNACFNAPRGRHSEKPDAFYRLLERVTDGPRLDMFARQTRRDWVCWGDEV